MRPFTSWILGLSSLIFCAAEPIARPEATPQGFVNNAPFSGAIYIVNSNGDQIIGQGGNFCPSSASVSCSSVNQPSWCCPANYVCAIPSNSNGLIGCCPSGSTCAGVVNQAQVVTVTVSPHQQTAVVYAQPPRTTVFNNPNPVYGAYCATLTMHGPGLPKEVQGQCGTMLIMNEGIPSAKMFSIGAGVIVVLLHLALGRMFNHS